MNMKDMIQQMTNIETEEKTKKQPINEAASRPRVTRGFRHGGYTAIIELHAGFNWSE